ncbi:MAG: hypothetical protein AMXMBFR84_31860 [Candidatus Hydrogenedentota bacterium]
MTPSPGTQAAPSAGAVRRAWSNPFRAAWRTLAILLACAFFYTVWHCRILFVRDRARMHALCTIWTRRWAAVLRRCAGIRVSVAGPIPPNGVMIAPNHSGYLDVLAIGSIVPCFFVAKADVESWPIVGSLFRVSGHISVSRKRSKALADVTEAIEERLREGQSVCVFLEGTSTGNDRVLPFYPPLVEPAIRAEANIVPLGIRWRADDPRIDVAEDVAYWKDHTFGPHAWRVLGLREIEAELSFGDPVFTTTSERKKLAHHCGLSTAFLCTLPYKNDRPV